MPKCDRCRAEANILNRSKVWHDQKQDCEEVSLLLGIEFGLLFPGRWVIQELCWRCTLSSGYQYAFSNFKDQEFYVVIDGDQDSLPVEVRAFFDRLPFPVVIEVSEPVMDWPSNTEQACPHRATFSMRVLESDIAQALVKGLFEDCGYEVRYSGYEHVLPGWVSAMKAADASRSVLEIRSTPDLQVYDRDGKNLYEVEIKVTGQEPLTWRYRKDRLDTLRVLHPQALIAVYSQRLHEVFVQRAQKINWDSVPVSVHGDDAMYELNLGEFLLPHELFPRITLESYRAFLEGSRTVLRNFKPPGEKPTP